MYYISIAYSKHIFIFCNTTNQNIKKKTFIILFQLKYFYLIYYNDLLLISYYIECIKLIAHNRSVVSLSIVIPAAHEDEFVDACGATQWVSALVCDALFLMVTNMRQYVSKGTATYTNL